MLGQLDLLETDCRSSGLNKTMLEEGRGRTKKSAGGRRSSRKERKADGMEQI